MGCICPPDALNSKCSKIRSDLLLTCMKLGKHILFKLNTASRHDWLYVSKFIKQFDFLTNLDVNEREYNFIMYSYLSEDIKIKLSLALLQDMTPVGLINYIFLNTLRFIPSETFLEAKFHQYTYDTGIHSHKPVEQILDELSFILKTLPKNMSQNRNRMLFQMLRHHIPKRNKVIYDCLINFPLNIYPSEETIVCFLLQCAIDSESDNIFYTGTNNVSQDFLRKKKYMLEKAI